MLVAKILIKFYNYIICGTAAKIIMLVITLIIRVMISLMMLIIMADVIIRLIRRLVLIATN